MSGHTSQTNGAAHDHNVTTLNNTSSTNEFAVHTSLCFDPKEMKWLNNVTFTVDTDSGLIVKIVERKSDQAEVAEGDRDLRGKVVLPGLVDAHTHIFLHAYA